MKKFAAILLAALLLSGCAPAEPIQPGERIGAQAVGTFKVVRAEMAPTGSVYATVEIWQDKWGNCYAVTSYRGGITQVPKEACE